jgi:hypothetical protein
MGNAVKKFPIEKSIKHVWMRDKSRKTKKEGHILPLLELYFLLDISIVQFRCSDATQAIQDTK